ncbi:hypothetical protein VNO78_12476 [Psophocarpus tetragonolobus]|uniref:R13L1/DRL21-like LRR repeat region domain-containing protein n=1 Tax=Psophocarpus tetragonolobus TaxID=3891 RepID=A0AAN9SNE9_PSOTE
MYLTTCNHQQILKRLTFQNGLGDSLYSNVAVLRLSDCNYCLSLPSFGQLPSLKELLIKRMKLVKAVGYEFYFNKGSLLFQLFPLLESLHFEEMSKWEEWLPFEDCSPALQYGGAAPKLVRYNVSSCEKLKALPEQIELRP